MRICQDNTSGLTQTFAIPVNSKVKTLSKKVELHIIYRKGKPTYYNIA